MELVEDSSNGIKRYRAGEFDCAHLAPKASIIQLEMSTIYRTKEGVIVYIHEGCEDMVGIAIYEEGLEFLLGHAQKDGKGKKKKDISSAFSEFSQTEDAPNLGTRILLGRPYVHLINGNSWGIYMGWEPGKRLKQCDIEKDWFDMIEIEMPKLEEFYNRLGQK